MTQISKDDWTDIEFPGPTLSLFGLESLQEEGCLLYKKEKRKFGKKMDVNQKEVREENRKIRYLRFLVDFSILSIQQDDLVLQEAQDLVENVKRAACNLFPGKEDTFELIYRPRFNRVIGERFGEDIS